MWQNPGPDNRVGNGNEEEMDRSFKAKGNLCSSIYGKQTTTILILVLEWQQKKQDNSNQVTKLNLTIVTVDITDIT